MQSGCATAIFGARTIGEPQKQTGTIDLRLEPPDACSIRLVGEVPEAELRAMYDTLAEYTKGQPRLRVLGDTTRMGALSPGVRQIIAEGSLMLPDFSVAVVGASFTVRVLAQLILKAVILTSKRRNREIAFFETEAEARAWLDERRHIV